LESKDGFLLPNVLKQFRICLLCKQERLLTGGVLVRLPIRNKVINVRKIPSNIILL
jgi:hypothetical protein